MSAPAFSIARVANFVEKNIFARPARLACVRGAGEAAGKLGALAKINAPFPRLCDGLSKKRSNPKLRFTLNGDMANRRSGHIEPRFVATPIFRYAASSLRSIVRGQEPSPTMPSRRRVEGASCGGLFRN